MNGNGSPSVAGVLASAWQRQRNARSPHVFWGWLAFWGLMPIGLYAWMETTIKVPQVVSAFPAAALRLRASEHHAALLGGATMAAFAAGFGWFFLVGDVLAQNQPSIARLVPGHVVRLRMALLVVAALGVLLAAAVPGELLEAPLEWAVGAAALLPLVALAKRWPAMWVSVCAVQGAVLPALFSSDEQAGVRGALAAVWRQDTWLCAALVLTAGALVLVALVRDDGQAGRALGETGRLLGRRLAGCAEPGSASISGLRSRAYAWWLARTLVCPRSRVTRRLLLGLGPAAHWTTVAYDGLISSALFGILCALMAGLGTLRGVETRGALPCLSFGLVAGTCVPALQAAARLPRTRREQALLALLPGVPRGVPLNRWLAWRMSGLLVTSALWAGALLGLLGVVVATAPRGPGDGVLDGIVPALATTLFPQVAWQWRRWARLGDASDRATLAGLAPFALAGVAGALHVWAGVAYLATGIAFAAFASACCAWRWWRMGREPTALPMGRLA